MSIISLFHSSQYETGSPIHLVKELKALQLQTSEQDFWFEFVKNINVLLSAKKQELWNERVCRFVMCFLKYSYKRHATERNSIHDRFVEFLIRYLLQGTQSKEKHVRCRVVLFLGHCIMSISEVTDETWIDYREKLRLRLFDKEAAVRLNAVHGLSRFQHIDADIEKALVELLESDPTAEVRKTVLMLIQITPSTLRHVVDRSRDTDPNVRKVLYKSKLVSVKVEELSDQEKVDLITHGLLESDNGVYQACTDLFFNTWMKQYHNDIREFLEPLDIVNREKLAGMVLQGYFKWSREFSIGSINPRDLENPESVFLIRQYVEFLILNKARVDEVLLETAQMMAHFNSFRQKSFLDKEDCFNTFVQKEMLILFKYLDYGDEVGRRLCFSLLRDLLLDLSVPEILVKHTVFLLGEIVKRNVKDWLGIVLQVVVDLKDMYGFLDPHPVDQERVLARVRCMSMIQVFFENVSCDYDEIPFVYDILNELIVPAINSKLAIVQHHGLRVLGLISVISKPLATQYAQLFLDFVARSQDETQVWALKIVFDLVAVFGKEVFPNPDLADVLRATLHLENVGVVAAEGFGKLLVLDLLSDPGLIEEMMFLYFSPDTRNNPQMKQVLSFFIQAFCSSKMEHQQLVGQIFFGLVKRLSVVIQGDSALTISSVSYQILFWISHRFLYQACSVHNVHVDLAQSLCKQLLTSPSDLKLFSPILNRLELQDPVPEHLISELFLLTSKLIRLCNDKGITNHLKKFAGSLVEQRARST